MTNDYVPIGCDMHSEYELLAMHRARVELEIEGETQPLRLRVCDLVTQAGAEFLITENAAGERQQWRLDRVRAARRLPPGSTW